MHLWDIVKADTDIGCRVIFRVKFADTFTLESSALNFVAVCIQKRTFVRNKQRGDLWVIDILSSLTTGNAPVIQKLPKNVYKCLALYPTLADRHQQSHHEAEQN